MTAQKTGGMEVLELRAFTDNYIWLLLNPDEKHCAVVDPGDAQPVIDWLNEHPQWTLGDVLITHHHHDHVGGIDELRQQYNVNVIGPAQSSIPGLDLVVGDNDEIKVLGRTVRVIAVPGHTLDHVAFYLPGDQILFSGDTLFAAGCGRLFEGTAGQMLDSLERLAALPDATRVYCAHEYTLGNLHFAQAVGGVNTGSGGMHPALDDWPGKGHQSVSTNVCPRSSGGIAKPCAGEHYNASRLFAIVARMEKRLLDRRQVCLCGLVTTLRTHDYEWVVMVREGV